MNNFAAQLDEIRKNREQIEVRYIKLGQGGGVAEECFEKNLLYIGYDTHDPQVRGWCNQARTPSKRTDAKQAIQEYWIGKGKNKGTAANFANSVLSVATDHGNVVWITFHKRQLYYGLTTGGELFEHSWESQSGSKKEMKYGWFDKNINDQILHVDKLSGSLTKTQGSRGTIASIEKHPANYFLDHLLGEPLKLKEEAVKAKREFIDKISQIIKALQPSEFEVLIDLIFANSGWKRDGDLGGNIKFVDVTLMLPSTGERAAVQVKTATNEKEAQQYVDGDYSSQGFNKFFYVYHTGKAQKRESDRNYYVWGLQEVAEKAVDAGLSQWVIDRSYQ